ncbi:tetratricopeptide repeat protein [Ktedonospora formicarum]|uniref:HTH cro/C1-type domain-containing protein n=1 Tax=Ktedonospora formicarum TaxID=2778364 RepID=A0A8J3HUR5_9CHLR|nr:tetratricopeptide repeat protein [Ktedonospora formicarum]GHO44129.1 hypothetical protein KSX_22920 [Ktedonospora formicarum]
MKPNQRLRRERELRGWSQSRVAQEIGTDPATVSRWERGLSFPYPYFRERLCDLFGKNAEELGLVHEDVVQTPPEPKDAPSRQGEVSEYVPSSILSPALDPAIPLLSTVGGSLVGRDALLRHVSLHLCDEHQVPALVALNGIPGVGKTSLAVALAHDPMIRHYFSDGILWAGLGPHPQIPGHLSRWGMLLHIDAATLPDIGMKALPSREHSEPWVKALRFAIGQRRILIIIDDVWQIEDALNCQIGGPNCAILLTTRFPHIALHFAENNATLVSELSEGDGMELLGRLAPHVVQEEAENALELVRSVGGLPLALTLIGKYLRTQSYSRQPRRIAAALARLRHAPERLNISEPRSFIDRHTSLPPDTRVTLQAIIEVSDVFLDEEARTALRALSVFPAKPNSFAEEAALAVMQLPHEALDALSDAGLLESSSPNRYALHQTIADYARVQLEDNEVYHRLAIHFVAYLEQHASDYHLLDQESQNIHAALEAARTHQIPDMFLRGIRAISSYLFTRGRYAEAERYLSDALELAHQHQRQSDLIAILRDLGRIARKSGNYLQAETYYQRGLQLARHLKDEIAISDLLTCLGTILQRRGYYNDAIMYFEEGTVLTQRHANQEQFSQLLLGLAHAHGSLDHYKEAEEYAWESLELARGLDNPEHQAKVLLRLGTLIFERSDYEQALGLLFEALEQARQIGHRELTSQILNNLGCVLGELGDFKHAEAYLLEAQILARQINAKESLCNVLTNLGFLANERGQYEQGEAYAREGLELSRQIGHTNPICGCLDNMGNIMRFQGKYKQAIEYYEEGLVRARLTNNKRYIVIMLTGLGATMTACTSFTDAESYLSEAMILAREIHRPRQLCDLLFEYGKLKVYQRQPQPARTYFQEMLDIPDIGDEGHTRALYGLARVAELEEDFATAHRLGSACAAFFASRHHHLTREAQRWLRDLPAS